MRQPFLRGDKKIERIQNRVNEQIRVSPVRVISETGEQLGIMPTAQAQEKEEKAKARERHEQDVDPTRPPLPWYLGDDVELRQASLSPTRLTTTMATRHGF